LKHLQKGIVERMMHVLRKSGPRVNESEVTVKPPLVQTSLAHISYAQFLSVNVSNRAAQCQISWPTMARKQQWDSHVWF